MATVEESVGAGDVDRVGEARLSWPSVSLLEVEPDLADALDHDQRDAARRFRLPVATVARNEDVRALLDRSNAFGALVLEGAVLHALELGDRVTLRLLGPGAVLPLSNATDSAPLGSASVLVPDRTRLVLLGKEYLVAARRWPLLVARLHARTVERLGVLMTQLAASQLPRVEDRVMALMWLLADSWGLVTPAGVRLPLSLTHEMLGGLVGAQRPTVTLALAKLSDENLLIKQDAGWLLLGPPPASVPSELDAPQVLRADSAVSPWVSAAPAEQPSESHVQIVVARLRQSHWHAGHLAERARALCESSQSLRHQVCERRRLRRHTADVWPIPSDASEPS